MRTNESSNALVATPTTQILTSSGYIKNYEQSKRNFEAIKSRCGAIGHGAKTALYADLNRHESPFTDNERVQKN
jgi:hypothetical protein